ncbi:hypothetical protein Dsin_016439 [Dipteronia sinensis]|uniref:Uncharacterized protein n=1 Tax=Dipteronia sinensis TaxID=43782 RepID=A0AAE0E6Y7_9ROSI|nr:hypothetical protein Dsin_016439 [Dipteronia sinensis]
MKFLDGTHPYPSKTLILIGSTILVENPYHKLWIHHDRLVLLDIQTVVTGPKVPLVSRCNTAQEAWNKLKVTYANKLNTRMIGLINLLTKVSQEGKTIYEYTHALSATKFEEEVCYIPTEDDLVNNITRQDNDNMVAIDDDDNDDSREVYKISTSKAIEMLNLIETTARK